MKKRALACFLTVVMLMGILPTAVLAASDPSNYSFDISEGNIAVASGDSDGNIKVTYGDPQTTVEFAVHTGHHCHWKH